MLVLPHRLFFILTKSISQTTILKSLQIQCYIHLLLNLRSLWRKKVHSEYQRAWVNTMQYGTIICFFWKYDCILPYIIALQNSIPIGYATVSLWRSAYLTFIMPPKVVASFLAGSIRVCNHLHWWNCTEYSAQPDCPTERYMAKRTIRYSNLISVLFYILFSFKKNAVKSRYAMRAYG